MTVRVLPTASPAQGLCLEVAVTDPATGQPSTLTAIEERAANCPTFANVRYVYDALDAIYPDWRERA